MSFGIIGGADGPTAIFITASEPGWFNWEGLFFVLLILVPNILYAFRHKEEANLCTNKWMNLLEQIGRYGCMLLMVTGLGFFQFGFKSIAATAAYIFLNPLLILAYWLCWIPWSRKKRKWNAQALALLPAAVFLNSGLATGNWLLAVLAVLFGYSHLYVSLCNFFPDENR